MFDVTRDGETLVVHNEKNETIEWRNTKTNQVYLETGVRYATLRYLWAISATRTLCAYLDVMHLLDQDGEVVWEKEFNEPLGYKLSRDRSTMAVSMVSPFGASVIVVRVADGREFRVPSPFRRSIVPGGGHTVHFSSVSFGKKEGTLYGVENYDDGLLHVWSCDLTKRKFVKRFELEERRGTTLCLGCDIIYDCGSPTMWCKVFDLDKNECLHKIDFCEQSWGPFDFSPHAKALAWQGTDYVLRVYDCVTKTTAEIDLEARSVLRRIRLAHDGETLFYMTQESNKVVQKKLSDRSREFLMSLTMAFMDILPAYLILELYNVWRLLEFGLEETDYSHVHNIRLIKILIELQKNKQKPLYFLPALFVLPFFCPLLVCHFFLLWLTLFLTLPLSAFRFFLRQKNVR